MGDHIDKGLADCGEGLPYADQSPGQAAAEAAYAVLRCCGLITAGDWRVPRRVGRTVAEMMTPRPPSSGW